MGTMVDAAVRSEEFALGETFEELPDAEFETLRLAVPDLGRLMPFVWASADDRRALHRALRDDATTESVEFLSLSGSRCLYRIGWGPHVRDLIRTLLDGEGILVGAHAKRGQWTFQMLFPDHDALSTTFEGFRDHGIDLTIERVKGGTADLRTEQNELSEKQFEALAVAFDRGYYAVPRRMTLEDLAREVGVSHQALSERLRRAHQVVISDLVGGISRPRDTSDHLVSTG